MLLHPDPHMVCGEAETAGIQDTEVWIWLYFLLLDHADFHNFALRRLSSALKTNKKTTQLWHSLGIHVCPLPRTKCFQAVFFCVCSLIGILKRYGETITLDFQSTSGHIV